MGEQSGKFGSERFLVGDGGKRLFLYLFGLTLCATGLHLDSPETVFNGILRIITEPDYLISDYFYVGGRGAAFLNSGILVLLFTTILVYYKVRIRGISIASIFTVAGFSLFGKNLFNVWFIFAGVWLYARHQRESFLKFIYIAFFGTSLAPLVSQLMFGAYIPAPFKYLAGAGAGLAAGFILPSLVPAFLSVHKGYNLYNVGFAAGMIGTIFVSLLRSHGFVAEARVLWSTGSNVILAPLLLELFLLMILVGNYLNNRSFSGLNDMWSHPGRLLADFVDIFDFPLTLVNMGINGMIVTLYLLFFGDMNGPTLGGVLTVVGFSAMGKTPRTILPVIAGVMIGSISKEWGLSDPSVQLAVLFGTTLAPISGEFGWKAGMIAGYIHTSVVQYVGVLHAGFNLYNNGFAGGLVAGMLVPLFEALRGRRRRGI
ncbi:MAG: DUF1576 domain-containing protein [Synergistaceae bacterium]|nr:DUF1576 domain-containing protein [Synergistota bacterium]NLM71799.1 DUF1576 domain-containing protein [Synergistaceae bacterium]